MELTQILTLIQAVNESQLTKFSIEQGDLKISMQAQRGVLQPMADVSAISQTNVSMESLKQEASVSGQVVTSPLVGTFYSSPSTDAAPFVAVGDTVKAGQVLGIVEAMKLMNEIESEYTGTVQEILVENEQTVEYGQPLFIIA